MSKILKTVLENLIYILLLIAISAGTPKALSYVMGTSYPIASITSGSMWPVLKKGDLVLIKYVKNEDIKIGDIVVFKNENGFTIHRVTEITGNKIRTKGDANNISDLAIEYKDIVGRTLIYNEKPVKIPYLGNLTIWASGR
ncbi:MAG: signal peptidase I [Minisyncoccia bacterium]